MCLQETLSALDLVTPVMPPPPPPQSAGGYTCPPELQLSESDSDTPAWDSTLNPLHFTFTSANPPQMSLSSSSSSGKPPSTRLHHDSSCGTTPTSPRTPSPPSLRRQLQSPDWNNEPVGSFSPTPSEPPQSPLYSPVFSSTPSPCGTSPAKIRPPSPSSSHRQAPR